MKFVGRGTELSALAALEEQSKHTGIMTVLTGRRRIGKTSLALHHCTGKSFLYLFIGRKEEHLLCQEFKEEIIKTFHPPIIGEIKLFKDIFVILLEFSKTQHFTLIIDEFQEFFQINLAVYSDIQKLWDLNKKASKMHVIFIGSVYSLMRKIFENDKQPLFGRADHIISLKPLSLQTTASVVGAKNLFDFYLITGGSPKYLELLLRSNAHDFSSILDLILQKDSLFLTEGRNLLIEEFGKDYLTYFSILELISEGRTARGEIESVLEKDIGGYLERLESDYAIINRHRPIHTKPGTRNQKYKISDLFLNFWFRFIYRYRSAIEMENFAYVRQIIDRDLPTYSGSILERFFHQKFRESGLYNQIGSYWEKDNQNEIDLVALNDFEKKITIAEIKLNKSKIRLENLKYKAKLLLEQYPGYQPTYLALGLEDCSSAILA